MLTRTALLLAVALLLGAAAIANAAPADAETEDGGASGSVTPPPAEPAVPEDARAEATLLAAGDIAACESPGDEKTARLLDGLPGTVAALGDLAYRDGSEANFQDCYQPSWGRHRARTRPAVGNHEYRTPGAAPYFRYFGAQAGEPGKGYYSYELGRWHVVVLNSNCGKVSGGCAKGSPQERWLRADLEKSSRACTLAYFHHPRWSSAPHGPTAAMRDLYATLREAGADVVLAGHDHSYERFAPQDEDGRADPQGLRAFVVGTGGKSHEHFGPPLPNSEVRLGQDWGVLKLTLRPTRYDWEFIGVDGKGTLDHGSGDCVGGR